MLYNDLVMWVIYLTRLLFIVFIEAYIQSVNHGKYNSFELNFKYIDTHNETNMLMSNII